MHNQKGKVWKCPFQSKFKNWRTAPPPERAHWPKNPPVECRRDVTK